MQAFRHTAPVLTLICECNCDEERQAEQRSGNIAHGVGEFSAGACSAGEGGGGGQLNSNRVENDGGAGELDDLFAQFRMRYEFSQSSLTPCQQMLSAQSHPEKNNPWV